MKMTRDKIYNNEFYDSLSEVDAILEHMKITSVFPEKFIEFIKENKNYNYNFKYDTTVSLANQNITKTTKQILAILYSEYFCTTEQKKELENIWRENDKISLEQKEINYSKKESTVNNSMIENRVSLFKRILNKIKELMNFKKK